MGELVPFPVPASAADPYEVAVTLACEAIDRTALEIEMLGVTCGLEIIAGEVFSKLAQAISPEHARALAASFARREG